MKLLSDDYIAEATADARRYQGQWTGTAGTLAAHVMRLIRERERMLSMLTERSRQPKPVRVIGVAGWIGAGKSLVASMIPEAWHLQWADPIYRGLSAMLDVDEDDLRDRSRKEDTRHLLRTLGTEWGRQLVHPDLWVRLTMQRIDKLAEEYRGGTFAICGTRFPNEIAAVRERGGEVWWVSRPGNVMIASHSSDEAIQKADCDRVIENDGPMDALRGRVLDAYEDFLRARPAPEHSYNEG